MGEVIYACLNCKKIYAISDNTKDVLCPSCNEKMDITDFRMKEWCLLDDAQRYKEKQKYFQLAMKKRGWRELSLSNEVKEERPSEDEEKNNTFDNIKSGTVFLVIMLFYISILIQMYQKGYFSYFTQIFQHVTQDEESLYDHEDRSETEFRPEAGADVISSITNSNHTAGDSSTTSLLISAKHEPPDSVVYDTNEKSDSIIDNLLKKADAFSDNDTINIAASDDFDGDGKTDLIAESGHSDGDFWVQSFIFASEKSTYSFGEYQNSVYYSSSYYVLPVENGKLFVVSSGWRPAALGGYMSHAEVFSVGSEIAYPLFEQEFTEITGIDTNKGLLYVTYNEEAAPGGFEINRGILSYKDSQMIPYFISDNISEDYRSAKIKPLKDPLQVWNGIDALEVTGNYGIHFYIPANWSLYAAELNRSEPELEFYALDKDGHTGWILSTLCYEYEGNIEPFDWGEEGPAYQIGSSEKEHFYIKPAKGFDYCEPQYDPDIYFPELKQYRDMIAEAAWVE